MLSEFDDYPLQSVPKEARSISSRKIGMTAFGSMSFLAQESMGAMITIQFGFIHLLLALAISAIVIMSLSLPVVRIATRQHIDIDLISRGCGFGYLGASLSSFIYAGYICAFLAFESLIVLDMLRDLLGIPIGIGYFLFNIVATVLAIYGIRAIVKFQNITNFIWIALYALIVISIAEDLYKGAYSLPSIHEDDFNTVCLGFATAITLAFVTQTGEQVDYLRFSGKDSHSRFYNLLGGIFWFIPVMINMIMGGVISLWILEDMADSRSASQPYLIFEFLFNGAGYPHRATFALVMIFVILSQLKINVTNIYSGSLAWSNFSSRVTHIFPGRAFWAIFNTLLAFIIIESEIVDMPLYIFSIISILGLSWYGVLFTYLTVNHFLGLRPKQILFKRSQVPDIDPVGIVSMAIAVVCGLATKLLSTNDLLVANAHFISLFVAMGCTVIMATLLRDKNAQRKYQDDPQKSELCCVCHKLISPENLSWCPSRRAYICSECCSLEAGCYEQCKRGNFVSRNRLGKFPLVMNYVCVMGAFSLMLWVISVVSFRNAGLSEPVIRTFHTVFMLTDATVGVFYLMFLFVLQGRRNALMDLNRKNIALEDEVTKHQETQRQLVEARNRAVSANLAKNRYLSGISHELRTPLNTIMGYIQLLQRDRSLNSEQHNMLEIIKTSGGYLVDLIEGLLDISRIEAGKLEIRDERVMLRAMFTQLIYYFTSIAKKKGISFSCNGIEQLPQAVKTDGKRLRQIVTNLLSNAVKYTIKGGITVDISFRTEVMTLSITDTGVGMTDEFMKRMFEPFERAKDPSCQNVPGTGLGLTITRLLLTVMGGGLDVESAYGKGTKFTVRLKFSVLDEQGLTAEEIAMSVEGYNAPDGKIFKVLEVDDNEHHTNLIRKMLEPVGFEVVCAGCVKEALKQVEKERPDIIFLDISLPDGSGWDILGTLRSQGHKEPIVMVSAEATEKHVPADLKHSYDGYIIKPVSLPVLFDTLSRLLRLTFVTSDDIKKNDDEPQEPNGQTDDRTLPATLPEEQLNKIRSFLNVGFLGGIDEIVDASLRDSLLDETSALKIKKWIISADLNQLRRWAANGNK